MTHDFLLGEFAHTTKASSWKWRARLYLTWCELLACGRATSGPYGGSGLFVVGIGDLRRRVAAGAQAKQISSDYLQGEIACQTHTMTGQSIVIWARPFCRAGLSPPVMHGGV